ncbi:unnamed protein product, partial [Prorocentrum cordatum]
MPRARAGAPRARGQRRCTGLPSMPTSAPERLAPAGPPSRSPSVLRPDAVVGPGSARPPRGLDRGPLRRPCHSSGRVIRRSRRRRVASERGPGGPRRRRAR